MAISSTDAILRIFGLARDIFPGRTPRDLKNRVVVLRKAITHLREVRLWYGISDSPRLASALQRFPQINGAIHWPYINNHWSMARRLQAVDQHYRLLEGRAAILARAVEAPVELASLDNHYPGLRMVVDKAIWFLREGEIVLNLFLRDQRVYSIAFTLGLEDNQLVAYVGALQGSNVEEIRRTYSEMTRSLYGMRPRDLLVVALKILSGELQVTRIFAVADEARQHNSPYFGDSHKEKVLADYDEVWAEHGGTRLGNGFFEIPVRVKYRDAADIPTRKRATYRRRYEMLDRLALEIRAACAPHDTGHAKER